MPVLATDPLRFKTMLPKSMPLNTGASAVDASGRGVVADFQFVGDAIRQAVPWRLNTALEGLSVILTTRPLTPSG